MTVACPIDGLDNEITHEATALLVDDGSGKFRAMAWFS